VVQLLFGVHIGSKFLIKEYTSTKRLGTAGLRRIFRNTLANADTLSNKFNFF
jgi:hypothetical protein